MKTKQFELTTNQLIENLDDNLIRMISGCRSHKAAINELVRALGHDKTLEMPNWVFIGLIQFCRDVKPTTINRQLQKHRRAIRKYRQLTNDIQAAV